jgi:hypothetical protein
VKPSYDFDEERNIYTGSQAQNSHAGLFSGLARLDYGVPNSWLIGVYGAWEHYTSQSLPSGQPELCSDWAKFGAAVSYKPDKFLYWNTDNKLLFSIGYYYEAFNSDFDSHNVVGRFEYHF